MLPDLVYDHYIIIIYILDFIVPLASYKTSHNIEYIELGGILAAKQEIYLQIFKKIVYILTLWRI